MGSGTLQDAIYNSMWVNKNIYSPDAEQTILAAIKIVKSIDTNNDNAISRIYQTCSNVFYKKGEIEEALLYLIIAEDKGSTDTQAVTKQIMAQIYMAKGDYEKALEYIKIALNKKSCYETNLLCQQTLTHINLAKELLEEKRVYLEKNMKLIY
jgi:tetratricopeptide (TPR) repeat protein